MKKNKIFLFFPIMLIATALSCTKLEETTFSEIPIDKFGTTLEQVNALVGPLYSTLKNHQLNWDSYLAMSELSSDELACPGFKGGDWAEKMFKYSMQHTWSSSNTGYDGAYFVPMGNVSLCNQLYYMINTNTTIPADVKEITLSEIRGVRAFWYYNLCDLFGNVPIVTDYLDKTLPSTNSRQEVFAFVVNELNQIKDKLRKDVPSSSSYGKFTRGAAYTLLAKMYLNADVWNPAGGPKWTECIEACNEVMNMGYILENNWKINFIPENQSSKEAIFSAVFKADGSGVQNFTAVNTLHYLDPIALGLPLNAYNGFFANPDYVKSFDVTDIRYKGSFLIGPMIDPSTGQVLITSHGRPLIHTIDAPMNEVDGTGWGWVNQEVGARIYKWDYAPNLTYSMENDIHIFRLADVFLMKAEAIIRSNGNIGEATDLVNRIRERAFPNNPSKLLASATLMDVYNERRFEFAWEGFCRQDMIRFGKFLEARPPFKPWVSDPIYLLFAIPQTAIDVNNNIKQNPGY